MTLLTDLLGESPGIVALREQIAQLLGRYSRTRRPPCLLMLGETGTGKGMAARAIHRAGPRAAGPFVDVNCAAIPETLLEAELFGYERGAFTDARHAKAGLFQTAHRGTIFLDEVGMLAEALQAKLLTVIEDRAVRRLGATQKAPVDVWILTATSDDLAASIRARRFREDLYHRLAVVTLRLPPLRERGEDVLLLAEHFLERACAEYGLPPKALSAEARGALMAYRWPGNVRELGNVIERVALLCEAAEVGPAHLGLPEARRVEARPRTGAPPAGPAAGPAGEDAERAALLEALEETGWNVSQAAVRLRISRNTIRYRMEKHGIRTPVAAADPRPPAARPAEAGGEREGAGGRAVEGGPPAGPTGSAPAAPRQALPAPEAGEAEAPPASEAGVRWERRHVALLRADLADTAGGAVVESGRALETVIEKMQTFGGRIEELGPTRATAVFGLDPLEDAPRRAAHAAMAILQAAERGRRAPAGVPLARIGLHVGHLLVGRVAGAPRIDHDARAEALARLEAALARARPGQALLTEAAVPFLERRFALVPLEAEAGAAPALRLRGLEATGLGLGGRLARFVGREREIALLDRQAAEARAGTLRVVNVIGEAGLGKSRLLHELRRRLEEQGQVVLQGHCAAFGGVTPFLPFIEVVRSAFLVGEDEEPGSVSARLARGLELLGLRAEAALPFLQVLLGLEADPAALHGLNGEIVGARTRDVIQQVLAARRRSAPLVILLDDLHWTDTASEELVERLVEGEESGPLLLVCAFRPPYRPPWSGRPDATDLRLDPLTDESCLRLVRERAGAGPLPEALERRIVARAEGNPLFVEEMVRYVAEGGGARGAGSDLRIPGTLEHLLMPRVERLDAGARAFLEAAAVVGRRFSLDLVRAVSGAGEAAARQARVLEAQGLVVPVGGGEYAFRHVLLQDAVYDGLPAARREALHQRAGEAIEWLHATRLTEWVEVLAHHYARTPKADRAVRYLVQAGRRSLRVHSLEEAHARFEQAVRLMESPGWTDAALLVDAVLDWLQVYYYRQDFRGLVALAGRFRPRVEAVADPGRLGRFLFWLGYAHFFAARADEARAVLERSLALAESVGDDAGAGYALMALMYARWVKRGDGPRDVVARLGERALPVAERLGDVYLQTQCLHSLGLDAFTRGRYREARALGRRLVDLGRRTGGDRPVATGLHLLALVDVYEERYEEALAHAEESLRTWPTTGDDPIARTVKGAALALMGRPREGFEVLQAVRRRILATDYLVLLTGVDFPYGAAMALAGHIGGGVRWIEAAIRRLEGWGNETIPAVGHMILGEIHLRMVLRGKRPPLRVLLRNLRFLLLTVPFAAARARRHLERAIRIARAHDVPAVLARSLYDLGRLCHATRRPDEARLHLEEALRVAEPLELPVLAEKVRAALAAAGVRRARLSRAA